MEIEKEIFLVIDLAQRWGKSKSWIEGWLVNEKKIPYVTENIAPIEQQRRGVCIPYVTMKRLDIEEYERSIGYNPKQKHEPIKTQSNTPKAWDGFDIESEFYPEELDIAFIAWRGATQDKTLGLTPKQKLRKWLDNYYPKLSDRAKDRIINVANWGKQSGRPKIIK
jgi:hypothetical protein